MTTARTEPGRTPSLAHTHAAQCRIDSPTVADGPHLWRIARDSDVLDLNSPYSYLLWCRDFADTSVVARDPEGRPVAFVTGYLRPEEPGTLFVWQVAVDAAHRGLGLAAALLDTLSARVAEASRLDRVETTITPGNTPSEHLFRSYAARHGAAVACEVLFAPTDFPPPGHQTEVLYRIGPMAA
ncbi:diaminobutyrate acetyltransferase [Streptomyces sp. TRM76323]|uniref:L-2,4-diaminobutyric acid acetyltransferase n=1 Tax=Streptomyces tamarix TaxID=3078565 RepID=A0ABU3QRG8_9ACTN|nr:diaminobutyrate acetyltransferase [Streptomyces tamarix]MDT9685054.1 diaminobutyrate acetyltransferase [Streptomyces tamarix]